MSHFPRAATVSTVDPCTEPSVAVIVLAPIPAPVASPPMVIVAFAVVPDPHVTWLVRSCVLLPVYVPVALNCSVCPFAIIGFCGDTAIDCSAGPEETTRLDRKSAVSGKREAT